MGEQPFWTSEKPSDPINLGTGAKSSGNGNSTASIDGTLNPFANLVKALASGEWGERKWVFGTKEHVAAVAEILGQILGLKDRYI